MSALDEGRPPFLARKEPAVTAASARLYSHDGYRAAIIELGEVGRVHVHTSGQAREIAAAFASAAVLLAAAEAGEPA